MAFREAYYKRYEVDQAKKQAEKLKAEGYRWRYDSYSYQVWHNNEYIHGAGTATREPQHWIHAAKNRVDNFLTCVRTAAEHSFDQRLRCKTCLHFILCCDTCRAGTCNAPLPKYLQPPPDIKRLVLSSDGKDCLTYIYKRR